MNDFKFGNPIAEASQPEVSDAPSPLTPALSLREREDRDQCREHARPLELPNTRAAILPLPKGEGRGEGERNVRPSRRCDFCNASPTFSFN